MITDKDRSGYIGASDTERVIQSWNTATFQKWWWTKLGLVRNHYSNDSMMTGNALEHKILDSLGLPMIHDEQKIIGRLRVNLDGRVDDTIYECKTYRLDESKPFKPPKKYLRQVYSQMYAFGLKSACIVAYGLLPEDYRNWYLPIELKRLSIFPVEYDESFFEKYIPRLNYLEHCLDTGEYPTEGGIAEWKKKNHSSFTKTGLPTSPHYQEKNGVI